MMFVMLLLLLIILKVWFLKKNISLFVVSSLRLLVTMRTQDFLSLNAIFKFLSCYKSVNHG